MILHIENPKYTTKKKLLEEIEKLSSNTIHNQHTKNRWIFFTLTTNMSHTHKQSHLQKHQNNKIFMNKFNQGSKKSVHCKL